MNLRDLEYLVAVADHRHFGKAAAACGVGQPTLSVQLKKLEGELGVVLIERTSSGHIITDVGERIVSHARSILIDVDVVKSVAAHSLDPLTGRIRLGIFPTLAPYLLPHVLPRLRERLPRVDLHVIEERSALLMTRLARAELDAAVLALPVEGEDLVVKPLFREDFVLAMPAGHPLSASMTPIPISALEGVDVLILEDGHCLRNQTLDFCVSAGAREQAGFRVSTVETLRNLVAAGMGITLMPILAVAPPVVCPPNVVLRRFADPVPHRTIALVWRRSNPRTDVLDELTNVLGELPSELVERHPFQ